MSVTTRVSVLAAVSLSVPSAGAAQAPVAASCRAAEAMLRELAVPALEQRERAEALRRRFDVAYGNFDRAGAEVDALWRRLDDSADSLVSVLLGPAVADSLRSDRIWLNLSGSFGRSDDSPARKDSLARADSLMDARVRDLVGSAVADSFVAAADARTAATDSALAASGPEGYLQAYSSWGDGLLERRSVIEDELRARASAAAVLAATEADSLLTRRTLGPLAEAWGESRGRRDSLRRLAYGEAGTFGQGLYGDWRRADSLANAVEFDVEWDANELGAYAASVSIAVEFRGAGAGCSSCPSLAAVGDAWRLVRDRTGDPDSWPDDAGWWTDPDSWFRRMAGRSWDVFMSAVYDAAECFR